MVQFGILGPLEVLVDGEPVALGGPRQRAVLVRLLLDAGRVVGSERIIDDVWDGRPPPRRPRRSRSTSPSSASRCRTCVADHGWRATCSTWTATPWTRTASSGWSPSGDYDGALALWRGDVLTDLPDLGFVAPERARLDELRLFAIESRLAADLEAGRHGPSVGELTDLVEAHPLRERLTCLLMLALYRSGRQVEALRAFERHRRHLADEIGVEPDVGVRELEAAILRHDPGLDLRSRRPRPSLDCAATSR